jgi:hypothetical protein
MKYLKKINEDSIEIDLIIEDIKEIFLDISDNFSFKIDWDSQWSYGVLDTYQIKIFISTKEFMDEKTYGSPSYSIGSGTKLNFFTVTDYYGNDYQDEIINHYKECIELHNMIKTSLSRVNEIYSESFYQIEQKNSNKTEIKITINIPNETK